MATLQAVLWDVDGTMAETERDGHRVAFNLAFEACGLSWRWSEARYGELLSIAGGPERLMHDLGHHPDAPALLGERRALVARVHAIKNRFYAELVAAGQISLRPGVRALMEQCLAAGVRLGIATTTSRSNLDALLRAHLGGRWQKWFDATICAEDVTRKKPDPEVYVRALAALRLPALACIAIEDSPGGLAAARGADLPVVVTRSFYFEHAILDGAIAIGPGLYRRDGWRPALPGATAEPCGVDLDDLLSWRTQMDTVSQFG
ncbi:MAG: CbbY, protein of unknown function linked to the Calvin-Benson-Bassham cycle, HAD-like hydrolase [Pseudomonadota bacterium]|jgi:HAD superfamily hydrolase (TIGR01509 family)